ncbi:MAG: LacI family transcriptional regulator [Defluviitaleaceae bacterium]|nr:LacI family transcriptional regulator [Defluviitaleaceae bacterium]
MKPTVRTMAKELELSAATVSKALSGKAEISEQTREKVISYAKEVGYFKNTSLRGRLGVLVANPSDIEDSSILFHMLMGFQKYAEKLQNESVIINVNLDDMIKQTLDELIIKSHLDGLFVAGLKTTDPYYKQLETTVNPLVVMDILCHNPMVGTVGTDSIAGGNMAIGHLQSLGHRRIGFINGYKEAYISQERFAGYVAALDHYNMPFSPELCYSGDFSRESGCKAAEYFLDKKITAIYAASDIMALGALQHFASVGLSLPQDMSLVGFDGQPICLGSTPPLTTIAQNPTALGEAACTLLRLLPEASPIKHVRMEPTLVVRSSTCKI